MTIEQDFMRMVKVGGGLVNRGFNTGATTKVIASLPFMVDICSQMQKFCDVQFNSSDQHVDARDSRKARDQEDSAKLIAWFDVHDPFPHTEKIVSVATGLVGGEHVNCYDAFAVGTASIMNQVQGKRFADISFKRKHRVIPLINATSSGKVQDALVTVDPLLIFQRISIAKRSEEEFAGYFAYELAPFPLSIFENGAMRKTAKSALLKLFSTEKEHIDKTKCAYIFDGGMLLHRVPWTVNDRFKDMFLRYVKYLQDHYPTDVIVVFDGYDLNSNSIKGAERLRRASNKSCPDIQFDPEMALSVPKDKFLSSNYKKSRFIKYLMEALEKNGISTKQALDDADSLIVQTALQKDSVCELPVIVVAEDIDILVLLTALTPRDRKIYFLKAAKGNKPHEVFSFGSLDGHPFIRDNILFLYAMTGSDTTSAFFRKGKTTVVENLAKMAKDGQSNELKMAIECFKNQNLSHESVFVNGETVLLSIYKSPNDVKTLQLLRFVTFNHLSRNTTAIKLECLPPTAEAAREHFYRVYLQVQSWLGNELSPEEWGWKRAGDVLLPVQTTKDPAPPELLKMIFCQCKTGCERNCSCLKAGLKCSSICGSCQLTQCSNYKNTMAETILEIDYKNI